MEEDDFINLQLKAEVNTEKSDRLGCTESLRFVAGELGKSGRNLEQIGAKFLGKTWRNAYLHVHDLGHIGKLEANLDSFKTPLSPKILYT